MKQIQTNLTNLRKAAKVIFALAALLLLASVATAQTGGTSTSLSAGYDLSWWTVDNGGVTFNSGGNYTLGGTAGQPDAGVLSNDGYSLGGGFWVGLAAAAEGYEVYLPVALRDFE